MRSEAEVRVGEKKLSGGQRSVIIPQESQQLKGA